MTYILGIDGGNSKTLAVLGDESGRIVGVGRSGGSNHQGPGLEPAMQQVRLAADRAVRTAGLERPDIAAAYCALAGADLPEDFELLQPALEGLGLSPRVGLNNDTIAALWAGSDNPNAAVVILGAGNNAAARNAAGQEIRLPGLGWISGDWGGGGALARESVRLVARAWDGRGRPTMLETLVLRRLDLPDVETLIASLYHEEVRGDRLLGLAPLVFEAATAGDTLARELLDRSADEVVITAATLLRRLDILNVPADVVLGGSVFRGRGTYFLEAIRARLATAAPLANPIVPRIDPALGALFCGMDLLGIEVDREVRNRAEESYAAQEEVTA